MNPTRLAWPTPTGAILWELWARQRKVVFAQAIALLALVLWVYWPGASPGKDVLVPIAYEAAALAVIVTITGFCYMEIDARRAQSGIPGHLLLKPVTTARLVATPMFCGGVVVLAVFLAWAGLVLRPMGLPTTHLAWVGAVLLSFTWSVQAVVWSVANLNWGVQVLLVMLLAGGHLALALAPMYSPGGSLAPEALLLLALLAGAPVLARAGVARIRRGQWEGGEARTGLTRVLRALRWEGTHAVGSAATAGAKSAGSGRFASAFHAQFWLEWRGQGLKLPLFTALGLAFFILIQAAIQVLVLIRGSETGRLLLSESAALLLNFLVLTPVVCSGLTASLIAGFEPGRPAGEVPVFIAVRPLANSRIVLAKLAMAAASSLLTWGVVAAAILLWTLLGGYTSPVWNTLRANPASSLAGLLASSLLLVVLTWRNLVAGMWTGLAGLGSGMVVDYVRLVVWSVIGAQVFRLLQTPEGLAALIHWTPWVLGACLAAKLAASAVLFYAVLRKRAVVPAELGRVVAAWLAGGLVMALVVWLLATRLGAPQFWVSGALGSFLLLPLAVPALAPLALARNRHR